LGHKKIPHLSYYVYRIGEGADDDDDEEDEEDEEDESNGCCKA